MDLRCGLINEFPEAQWADRKIAKSEGLLSKSLQNFFLRSAS